MKRRTFIQTGALAVAGASALTGMSFSFPARKVGIQLYTLRDVIFKDAKGTLKQLADLGYNELETFGYNDGKLFGMAAKEFSEYVKSLGMSVPSGHYALGKSERDKARKGTILNEWERAVGDAKEVGQEYMVLAYLGQDERATLDDYKFVCEKVNKAGEVCKKSGIRMNYHNHDFEFVPIDGKVPYDMMLKELDPKLVGMEMDLYWTTFAGKNPLDYFSQYPGRFEQWHLKDMDKADPKKNANLGNGSIDFKKIMASAALSGMKHAYVEHDTYPGTSWDSVKADVVYAKEL
jgi:sugar phosphate isomerase/epimerase